MTRSHQTAKPFRASVEAAANKFVEHVIDKYGAKSALGRARIMRHEYRHAPQWLSRAIEILEYRANRRD